MCSQLKMGILYSVFSGRDGAIGLCGSENELGMTEK